MLVSHCSFAEQNISFFSECSDESLDFRRAVDPDVNIRLRRDSGLVGSDTEARCDFNRVGNEHLENIVCEIANMKTYKHLD